MSLLCLLPGNNSLQACGERKPRMEKVFRFGKKIKEERRIPYFTAAFEGDVSLRDPSVSAWTSAQTAADNKLELDASHGLGNHS